MGFENRKVNKSRGFAFRSNGIDWYKGLHDDWSVVGELKNGIFYLSGPVARITDIMNQSEEKREEIIKAEMQYERTKHGSPEM